MLPPWFLDVSFHLSVIPETDGSLLVPQPVIWQALVQVIHLGRGTFGAAWVLNKKHHQYLLRAEI